MIACFKYPRNRINGTKQTGFNFNKLCFSEKQTTY